MNLWRRPQTLCIASKGAVVAVCELETYWEICRWQDYPAWLRRELPYPYPIFTFSDTVEGVDGTLDQLFKLLDDREIEVTEMYVPHSNGRPFGSFGEKHPTFWDIITVFGEVGAEVLCSIEVKLDDLLPDSADNNPHARAT